MARALKVSLGFARGRSEREARLVGLGHGRREIMKRFPAVAIVVLAFVAFTASHASAHAFGLSAFGLRVGGVDPEQGDGSALVGGHLEFEESGTQFHIQPGIMYWSSNHLSDFNPNFDVMYHFVRTSEV